MLNRTALIRDPEAMTRSASPVAPASTPSTVEARPVRRHAHQEGGRMGGLVLTRQLGQSIMIGEEVEIQVVGPQGGKVRLKIIAPREIAVHRREIFDAIHADPNELAPATPQ